MKRNELFQFLATEELAPGVLSSSQLVSLALNAKSELSPASWVQNILGEILFRVMAYRGNISQEIQEFLSRPSVGNFSKKLEKLREGKPDEKIFFLEPIPEEGQFTRSCIYFNRRLKQVKEADGIFPLLNIQFQEAIAMPFKFTKTFLGEENGFFEGGRKPKRLEEWQNELSSLNKYLSSDIGRISLSLPLGPIKAGGGSLVLPIYLSIKKLNDPFFPEKDKYLATGTFDENGILEKVDGILQKKYLADRMGMAFVGPKCGGFSEDLSYESANEDNQVFFEKCKSMLGICPEEIKPEDAFKILEEFKSKMQRRVVTSHQAIDTLSLILNALENNDLYSGILWEVYFLIGTSHNHLGNSSKATDYLELAIEASCGADIVPALSSMAVSLADKGDIYSSKNYGDRACEICNDLNTGNPRKQIELKIQAKGSLAAQSLFQMGLWDDGKKTESKQLLAECQELSADLVRIANYEMQVQEAKSNWAQSQGQLAWWGACYDSASFIVNFDRWQRGLESLDSKVFKSQQSYLQRGRWHAAFRLALKNELNLRNWLQWPLPEVDRPHEVWLKGLSLKYRGYLHRSTPDHESARTDFKESELIFKKLYSEISESHIFEYIRGTIKVLEYISFFDENAKSEAYEIFQEMNNKNFYTKHPKASPEEWLDWISKSDYNSEISSSPQTYFVY